MGFYTEGKKKEKEFGNLVGVSQSDYANENQDMFEHWDLIYNDKKTDVKGMKKLRRDNPMVNEDWHWIELKNVNGDNGWLYGKAEQFAFETYNYWVIVPQDKLLKFVETHIIKKENEYGIRKPFYIYNRYGRKDEIMALKTLNLMSIASEIIEKDNFYTYPNVEFI